MIKVQEVMKKGVITANQNITIEQAAKIMTTNKVGSVVIMEGERPVGIVTSEDIVTVVANGLSPKRTKIKDLKKRPLVTAVPSESILDVAKRMVKTGYKRIPVVHGGRLVGIVSDKEILITTPELIDILSEKLKARASIVAAPKQVLSGICENCGGYSDNLKLIAGKWLCEDCR
ncbi:MAG: CBS domain-containing protein [Candidatus Aenigmatarchaeota archaeon]